MSTESAGIALAAAASLLERALAYTLGSLALVTPAAASNPTPCRGWDLHALLLHLDDSLAALQDAIETGHLSLRTPAGVGVGGGVGEVDPLPALRRRSGQLVGSWAGAATYREILVAGRPLTPGVVAAAGAVEITVHGWDVACACGQPRPIPVALAAELLELCPLLVTEADRTGCFTSPLPASPLASAGDRLVAFLGRAPAA